MQPGLSRLVWDLQKPVEAGGGWLVATTLCMPLERLLHSGRVARALLARCSRAAHAPPRGHSQAAPTQLAVNHHSAKHIAERFGRSPARWLLHSEGVLRKDAGVDIRTVKASRAAPGNRRSSLSGARAQTQRTNLSPDGDLGVSDISLGQTRPSTPKASPPRRLCSKPLSQHHLLVLSGMLHPQNRRELRSRTGPLLRAHVPFISPPWRGLEHNCNLGGALGSATAWVLDLPEVDEAKRAAVSQQQDVARVRVSVEDAMQEDLRKRCGA